MKLSEAIRLGIGAVDEIRSVFFMTSKDRPCGCAIGTALFSVGFKPSERLLSDNRGTCWLDACVDVWPWTGGPYEHSGHCIAQEISNRHFCQKESRERIAAWIADIEPAEVQTEQEVAHDPSPLTLFASGGAA